MDRYYKKTIEMLTRPGGHWAATILGSLAFAFGIGSGWYVIARILSAANIYNIFVERGFLHYLFGFHVQEDFRGGNNLHLGSGLLIILAIFLASVIVFGFSSYLFSSQNVRRTRILFSTISILAISGALYGYFQYLISPGDVEEEFGGCCEYMVLNSFFSLALTPALYPAVRSILRKL